MNTSDNINGIKCFLFEDVVTKKDKEPQVQSIFLFSDTQENAIKMFNESEPETPHLKFSTIRTITAGTLEFTEPVVLSEGLAEIVKMLLYTKRYVEGMSEETDNRQGKNTTKLYRYSPTRLIYILAKHSETKDKPKKVTLALDDSLFD